MVTRRAGTGGRSRRQEQEAVSTKQKAEKGHYEYELRSALFVLAYCLLNLWRLALSFWFRNSAPSVSLYACQNAWPRSYLASRCRSGGRELHLPCQPRGIPRYNQDAPISHAIPAATLKGRRRSNPC